MPQLLRALALLLAAALFTAAAVAQDKDKDKDKDGKDTAKKDEKDKDPKDKQDDKDKGKLKGFLPANFKKLGLSESQVQKIYKIQADYKAKIEDLDRQKKKL